jgi:hypothetical protein
VPQVRRLLSEVSFIEIAAHRYKTTSKAQMPCLPSPDDRHRGIHAQLQAHFAVSFRWRTLLASEGYYDSSECSEGFSQLFPPSAIHAIHIMLFLVAVTQILYTFLVLALCLWKVRFVLPRSHFPIP